MGVDQSKKRLGLKTGVEKGIRSEILRVGSRLVRNIIRLHPLNPWGTRGRESQTIYTPRSRVDQEHAQRASSEAARNELKGPSPKTLLLITIDLHFLNYRPRSTATPPPIPRSSTVLVSTSKMLFVFTKRKCSRKQRVLWSFSDLVAKFGLQA